MPNLPRRGGRILENGKIGVPVHSTRLDDGRHGRPLACRTVPHIAQGSLLDPQTATVDVELRDKKPFVGVGSTGPLGPRDPSHGAWNSARTTQTK